MVLEQKSLEEKIIRFKKFICSTKTKHNFFRLKYEISNKKKIKDIARFYDENQKEYFFVSTSVNPNKLDLPETYLGIQIKYERLKCQKFKNY